MEDALDTATRLPTFAAAVQRPNRMLLEDEDDDGSSQSPTEDAGADLWSKLRPHFPSVSPGAESAGVSALAGAWDSAAYVKQVLLQSSSDSNNDGDHDADSSKLLTAFFPPSSHGGFSSPCTPSPFSPQPLPTGLRPLADATLQQAYGTVQPVAAGGLTHSQAQELLSGRSKGKGGAAEEEDAETREVRQLMARLGIGTGANTNAASTTAEQKQDKDAWQPADLPPLGHGKEDKVVAYLRFGASRVAGTSAGGKKGQQVGLGSLGGAATAGPNDGLKLRGEDDLEVQDLSSFG